MSQRLIRNLTTYRVPGRKHMRNSWSNQIWVSRMFCESHPSIGRFKRNRLRPIVHGFSWDHWHWSPTIRQVVRHRLFSWLPSWQLRESATQPIICSTSFCQGGVSWPQKFMLSLCHPSRTFHRCPAFCQDRINMYSFLISFWKCNRLHLLFSRFCSTSAS